MKHKVLAIVVSLALIMSMVLPGTLAVSTDQDAATSVMTAAAKTTEKKDETTTVTVTPTTDSQTEKTCTCGTQTETHAEVCPLYVKPAETIAVTEKKCTCTPADGVHATDCPLYEEAPKMEATTGDTAADTAAPRETTAPAQDVEEELGYYEKITAAENLSDMLVYLVSDETALMELTAEQLDAIIAKADALYTTLGENATEQDTTDHSDIVDTVEVVRSMKPAAPTQPTEVELVEKTFEKTVGDSKVQVEGSFTENTSLNVQQATVGEINNIIASQVRPSLFLLSQPTVELIEVGDQPYVAMELTLEQDGKEVQPNGTVEVTVDLPSEQFKEGDSVIVYHVHENEDGTVEQEILDVDPIDKGQVTFEMHQFSYVIIVNGSVVVEGIQAFYTVDGTATNKHIHAAGVYEMTDGHVHLLLTADHQHAKDCYATTVAINNTVVSGLGGTKKYTNVKTFVVQNGDNESDVTNLLLHAGDTYIVDIDLGTSVKLDGKFDISVTWNDGTIGGFAISGMAVQIVFNDGIQKTVYSVNGNIINYNDVELGYVPEVASGDVVVYKIEVKNTANSTQALSNISIVDQLPSEIFDRNAIEFSTDGNTWQTAKVEDNCLFNVTSNLTLPTGQSQTYYVRATVTDRIQPATTYTNTAKIMRNGSTYKEDSADVKTASTGTLEVKKTVNKENDGDTLPDDAFTFTLTDSAGKPVANTAYTVTAANSNTVQSETTAAGTFTLKNGEKATFQTLLGGSYTISETENPKYTCGWDNWSTTVTVAPSDTAFVICTNTYKRQLMDLTIKKTGCQPVDVNQSFIFRVTNNTGFSLDVVVNGNGSVTVKDLPIGNYTVTEMTGWSWRYSPNGSKYVTPDNTSVTFTNNRQNDKWLDGDNYKENQFTVNSGNS